MNFESRIMQILIEKGCSDRTRQHRSGHMGIRNNGFASPFLLKESWDYAESSPQPLNFKKKMQYFLINSILKNMPQADIRKNSKSKFIFVML